MLLVRVQRTRLEGFQWNWRTSSSWLLHIHCSCACHILILIWNSKWPPAAILDFGLLKSVTIISQELLKEYVWNLIYMIPWSLVVHTTLWLLFEIQYYIQAHVYMAAIGHLGFLLFILFTVIFQELLNGSAYINFVNMTPVVLSCAYPIWRFIGKFNYANHCLILIRKSIWLPAAILDLDFYHCFLVTTVKIFMKLCDHGPHSP